MKRVLALLLATTPVVTGGARAEIVQKSDQGFISAAQVDVLGKTPWQVWQVLIAPAGWWNPVHSWSGDAANLFLDPQAGGCFCELLPKPEGAPDAARRGSIEHMRVIAAMPPKLLRLSGALGPLQGEALVGTLTIVLKPLPDEGGGTHLTWSYVVGGFMRMKVDDIAPRVDEVLVDQFARLGKAAVATAAAAPPASEPADEGHR